MRSRIFWSLAGALVLLLSGCSSGQDELRQYIADVQKRPGGKIDAMPEVKPYESFAYNAQTLRSPFTPAAPASANSGVRPDQKRNREFLEQFSLDTMQMVGTLKIGATSYGLVQTKDKLVHRVVVGNHMGQNDGKIVDITPSKISLIEIVPDGLGGYIERPAALGLTE